MVAVPLCDKYAALSHSIDLLLPFAENLVAVAPVTFFAAKLQINPQGIAKLNCRAAALVDDLQVLEEFPQPVIYPVAEFFPQPNVVLEAGRKVAQHRINLGWQGHEVGRICRK